MAKRYPPLNEEEKKLLKLAIDRAVEKKFGSRFKYDALQKKQQEELGEEIHVSHQTLGKFFNGGDEVSYKPSSFDSICEYIGEDNWKLYIEKNKENKQALNESIQRNLVSDEPASDEQMVTYSHKGKSTQHPRNKFIAVVVIGVLLTLSFAAYFISKQVSTAAIDAKLDVSAVTFVLDALTEIDRVQSASYIRTDSAMWYGAPFLDGKKGKLIAYAQSREQPVQLEQLTIPAGVQVTVECPIKGQLFIKLLASDVAEAQVKGIISSFKNAVMDKKQNITAESITSYTQTLSFTAPLKKDQSFELAFINSESVEMPWMLVNNIRFQKKEKFHDATPESSIMHGRILFTETEETQRLEAFDDLTVMLTNPLRVFLKSEGDSIHVHFSGHVTQLSLGSKKMNKPLENFMPRAYAIVLAIFPDWVWLIIISLISLIPLFIKLMKHVMKLIE